MHLNGNGKSHAGDALSYASSYAKLGPGLLSADVVASAPFPTVSQIEKLKSDKSSKVSVDGRTLTVADVVAVALHGTKVELSQDALARVEASVNFLEERKHLSLYGVTTGFGGRPF
jgi:phenylalanine ammonia-lyase